MVDRRGLLLAGATGALLAGCGASGPDAGAPSRPPGDDRPTATEVQADIELLNGVLGLELRSVALYRRLADPRGILAALLEQEQDHVARLRRAVRDLGGEPAVAQPGPDPVARSPLGVARRVEETQVAAYVDTLPKLSDPRLREVLAAIAGTEAQHLATVRAELGRDPAPTAFVTGKRTL